MGSIKTNLFIMKKLLALTATVVLSLFFNGCSPQPAENEYYISFDAKGGTSCTGMTVKERSEITLPSTTKKGYTFIGWYNADTGGVKIGVAGDKYTVSGDITLYARWTQNKYKVSFNTDGGTPCPEIIAPEGSEIALSSTTKDDYTFIGWYSGETGGVKIGVAGDKYTVSGDITLYARWTQNKYTVSFNTNGGSLVSPMTPLSKGSEITLSSTTKDGYTFIGWYNGETDGVKIGVAGDKYTVSNDITLYAHWVQNKYKVSFNTDGGTPCSEITIPGGSSIILPATNKAGYIFDGWYSAILNGEKIGDAGSEYAIVGNITLYARWTQNKYNVSFNTNGGSPVSPMTLLSEGSEITIPTTDKIGYTFDGWYSADIGGVKIGVEGDKYIVSSDITMYARWNKLNTSGGQEGETRTINGIECIFVKAGTFKMGSPENESGRNIDEKQHQVTLTKNYWIGKYEIMQVQYDAIMGPSISNNSQTSPVTELSFIEANNFCKKVGGGLPTEAQWEFAARGGDKSNGYIYSGSNDKNIVSWNYGNAYPNTPKQVGGKNSNELGIYDMSGNASEWCSDIYGLYPDNAVTDPTGPTSGEYRVIRGGNIQYNSDLRVASRKYGYNHTTATGLRICFPAD